MKRPTALDEIGKAVCVIVVHVREDGHNRADIPRRFGPPGGRVKIFDKNLVHAIVGGKDPDCASAKLTVDLLLTCGHGPVPRPYNTSGPTGNQDAITQGTLLDCR